MVEAHKYASKRAKTDEAKWVWKAFHMNIYANEFISKANPFWMHKVPVGGNGETISLSKSPLANLESDGGIFKSTLSANYKQVVAFGETPDKDQSLLSIDTGFAGTIGSPHFFNLMEDHNKGTLLNIHSSSYEDF